MKFVAKLAVVGVLASVLFAAAPVATFAHVVVKPGEAVTGAYQTFTTSVPNEKDIPTVGLRVVIPESIDSVTPTVKPGWEIQTKKSGERVTEITWTGGSIPAEMRDEFTFSAHLPSEAGDIHWKAYQTYQDGTVVSWDQAPSTDAHGHGEDENKGPYSTTVVTAEAESESADGTSLLVVYVVAVSAFVLSLFALLKIGNK